MEDIEERDIRIISGAVISGLFIIKNWGHSILAIKHIVLTCRTHSMSTIEGELARALGQGLISFGQTIANLIVFGALWVLVSYIIKKFSPNFHKINADAKTLIRENTFLRETLSNSNRDIEDLTHAITQLTEQSPHLKKHKEEVTGLIIELDKLAYKKPSARKARQETNATELDLFKAAPSKKKSKPTSYSCRRRPKVKPKF